jgi:hypothetical protein
LDAGNMIFKDPELFIEVDRFKIVYLDMEHLVFFKHYFDTTANQFYDVEMRLIPE